MKITLAVIDVSACRATQDLESGVEVQLIKESLLDSILLPTD